MVTSGKQRALLSVSLLFQLAALSSPGWTIVRNVKGGSFYAVICRSEAPCEVKSSWDFYIDAMKTPSTENKLLFRRQFFLVSATHQAGVIVAFVLTLVSVIALFRCGTGNTNRHLHTAYNLTALLLVTGVVMGELLYIYFVDLAFVLVDYDLSVGFPYCVLLYSLACIQVFIVVVLLYKGFRGHLTHISRDRRATGADQGELNLATI